MGAYDHVKNGVELAALHAAAMANNKEAISLLLEAGAAIGLSDKEGRTPWHAAAHTVSADLSGY